MADERKREDAPGREDAPKRAAEPRRERPAGGMGRRAFYLRMVASSIIRRRSRMLVALLAVAIGATVLSGLVTIYYDIPRQMGQEFRSYGANFILVPSGGGGSLSAAEAERAREYFPAGSVVGIAPYRYQTAKINEQPFMVAGTDLAEARKTSPYWFVSGDWPESAGQALIGQEVADTIRLLPGSVFTLTGAAPDGKSFSRDFHVSGVMQTGGTEEAFIFVSLGDFDGLMGEGAFDVVECSVLAAEAELSAAAGRIAADMPGVAPRLVRRVTQSEGTVLAKLQSLVYLVTVVVLLLTMICVATTMMAVVAERRKEIGLKKTLGAANSGIVSEFLGEGVFLGGLGGLLGGGLGFVFAQMVSSRVFYRSIALRPALILVTLIVSVLVTGLACLLPIRGATEVDPAIVLRGE